MVEPLFILQSILFGIGFVLETTLMYAIATRTPKNMSNIQRYVFMISFSNVLIISCFELLVVPQAAKRLPGITIDGLLKYFGNVGGMVTATVGSSVFSVPCVCVALCSIIRLLSISGIKLDKYRPLFTFVLLSGVSGPVLLIPLAYPFFFLNKEKLIALATARNAQEALDDLMFDRRPYMVFDLSSKLIIPAGGLFMLGCGTGAAVTVFANAATQVRSSQLMATSSISAMRHDLQRRVTITLLAQIGLPILGGIVAFIVSIPLIIDYFATNNFDISSTVCATYYIFGAYSILSALITLLTIKPYRNFVLNIFRRDPKKNTTQVQQALKGSLASK